MKEMVNEPCSPEDAKAFAVNGAITIAKMLALLSVETENEKTKIALQVLVDGAMSLGDALVQNHIPQMPESVSFEEAKEILIDRGQSATAEILLAVKLGLI